MCITDTGLSYGNISNNIPGMIFRGDLEFEINTMVDPVSELIKISDSKSYALDLPAAVSANDPYFAIVGKGLDNENKFEVVLAGQSISADKFTFKQEQRSDGEKYVSMLMEGGTIALGNGLTDVNNLNGTLSISPYGIAGEVELDSVSLDLGPVSISLNQLL